MRAYPTSLRSLPRILNLRVRRDVSPYLPFLPPSQRPTRPPSPPPPSRQERAGHKGRFFSFASNADSGAQKGVHFEGAGLDGVWREIRRDRPGFAGVVAEMVPRGGRRVEKLVAARMLPLFSGDIRNSVRWTYRVGCRGKGHLRYRAPLSDRRGGERYDLLFQRAA